jgi:hypothetical protein
MADLLTDGAERAGAATADMHKCPCAALLNGYVKPFPSASQREASGAFSRDAQRLLYWHDVADLHVGGQA